MTANMVRHNDDDAAFFSLFSVLEYTAFACNCSIDFYLQSTKVPSVKTKIEISGELQSLHSMGDVWMVQLQSFNSNCTRT